MNTSYRLIYVNSHVFKETITCCESYFQAARSKLKPAGYEQTGFFISFINSLRVYGLPLYESNYHKDYVY